MNIARPLLASNASTSTRALSIFAATRNTSLSSLSRLSGALSHRSSSCSQQVKGFSHAPTQESDQVERIRSKHVLETLRPERLVSTGQQIFDFSGRKWKDVMGCTLHYYREKTDYVPFPPGTKGVLYYWPGSTEMAGQVRLRICDDVSAFEEGKDLLHNMIGRPWSIALSQLVHFPYYQPILDVAFRDGIITRTFADEFRTLLLRHRQHLKYPPLYTISDPFYIDFSGPRHFLCFLTWNHYVKYGIWLLENKPPSPYSGVIKARFELSTFPEHKELGPTLVLKVLEVVKPIQLVSLHPRGRIQAEPGGYYYREFYGRMKMWCWVLNRSRYKETLNELLKEVDVIHAK